jgi:hypothetical protein
VLGGLPGCRLERVDARLEPRRQEHTHRGEALQCLIVQLPRPAAALLLSERRLWRSRSASTDCAVATAVAALAAKACSRSSSRSPNSGVLVEPVERAQDADRTIAVAQRHEQRRLRADYRHALVLHAQPHDDVHDALWPTPLQNLAGHRAIDPQHRLERSLVQLSRAGRGDQTIDRHPATAVRGCEHARARARA